MPSTNGHDPKRAVLYTLPLTEEGKFYRHNRARLLAWLWCYSDHHEPGYGGGVPDFREMEGYGARSPLNNRVLKRLDDEAAYRSHRILTGAVEKLKRERWRLYEGLLPVYFAEDPNPRILDRLHEEPPDLPAARLALAAHDEALEFIHAHVERELSRHGLERLKVNVPWWTPGTRPRPIKPGPATVLEAYYGHLETDDKPAAVHRAAEETGYAAKSVRAVVRRFEGVLTLLSRRYHVVAERSLGLDGSRLRKLRREHALSQADLERMTSVTQRTISDLENDKRGARHCTVRTLAKALGVEPRELMKGEGDA